MGVQGTFCHLCALPVQHDHYVPIEGMLQIYRGSLPSGGDWSATSDPFRFTAEHAWLRRGVALRHQAPHVLHGEIEDESIASAPRRLGFARAYHEYCWTLLGSPTDLATAPTAHGAHAWTLISAYHEQLFAVRELAQDGKAWALSDPATSSRSRTRIATLAAEARRVGSPTPPPRTVRDVIDNDRRWLVQVFLDANHRRLETVRFRADITRTLDLATYATMICRIAEYAGDATNQPGTHCDPLENYEQHLKAAVEIDHEAILVATTIGGGAPQAQYFIYARDEAQTLARIAAVPGLPPPTPDDYANEADPTWRIFFDEVVPTKRGTPLDRPSGPR